ncbi:hypothetical protein ACQFYA_03955 [Promicromonospora sp. Marseille-Q5078]
MSSSAERDGKRSSNWLRGLAISLPIGVALGMATHNAAFGVIFAAGLAPAFASAFSKSGDGPTDSEDGDKN